MFVPFTFLQSYCVLDHYHESKRKNPLSLTSRTSEMVKAKIEIVYTKFVWCIMVFATLLTMMLLLFGFLFLFIIIARAAEQYSSYQLGVLFLLPR